mgnify:FL=1
MRLRKPAAVENDPYKSAKWDELTAGHDFDRSAAPALALLCQWHKVAAQAVEELDSFGGQTAYTDEVGDLRSFPQIATLKTASGEIRQLTAQLGIGGETAREEPRKASPNLKVIESAMSERARRARRAV